MKLMSKIDPGVPVTNKTLGEAVDTILKGMDQMFIEERKFSMQTFATKEDLKNFASKDDLKREIGWLRDDIKGLTSDLSDTVSKREFNQLKEKMDKHLPGVVS